MTFRFSRHVLEEMQRRNLDQALVLQVLQSPEQIVQANNDNKIYQSRLKFGPKLFLVRVVVDEEKTPPIVVTVYRTSKIEKYWSQNESDL